MAMVCTVDSGVSRFTRVIRTVVLNPCWHRRRQDEDKQLVTHQSDRQTAQQFATGRGVDDDDDGLVFSL